MGKLLDQVRHFHFKPETFISAGKCHVNWALGSIRWPTSMALPISPAILNQEVHIAVQGAIS